MVAVFRLPTVTFALATIAPDNVAGEANIRVAMSKTNLKTNPSADCYQGVKIHGTDQDILDATHLIHLHGKKYRLGCPDKVAKVT